jgi:hypothetical protein
LTPEESELASVIYSSVLRLKSRPNGPAGVAGLELQVALMLLDSDSGAKPADNNYWDAKCQLLLVRPAIEPIACSYWKRFGTCDLDDKVALVIASTLAGRPLVYRKGPATGRAAHGDVTFEPHDVARQWLAKIAAATKRPELLAALPIYAFAQTIMSHPFSDGNGRFARLMVHAALAKCAGLRRPEIALAPAFYRRANALGAAVTALSESQDWQPFNAVFLSILEDALALTRAFHRQRRGGH